MLKKVFVLLWSLFSAAAVCESLVQQQAQARQEVQALAQQLSKDLVQAFEDHPVSGVDPISASQIFSNAFNFNAATTWSVFASDCTTFVSTGDIQEMWLRDSSIQIHAYMRFVNTSQSLSQVVESILLRQIRFFMSDNYASAFTNNTGPNLQECAKSVNCPLCNCSQCAPQCGNFTYQHDFELDSPLFMFLLSWQYFFNAPTRAQVFFTQNAQEFQSAISALINLLVIEQHHFTQSKYFYHPLPFPLADGIGLVWSYARPSDDQTAFYNIPQNAMAVVVLSHLADLNNAIWKDATLSAQLLNLSSSIDAAIQRYGLIKQGSDTILAYEVDGFGNFTQELDDANMPNLLWLPYLGYPIDDALYNRTRKAVLSTANLNYFVSAEDHSIAGLGSQHVTHGCRSVWPGNECDQDCIWHLGLIMQALTSSNVTERGDCLRTVISTAWHGLLHEGFWVSDTTYYNRDLFGWANALFSEWMITQYLS